MTITRGAAPARGDRQRQPNWQSDDDRARAPTRGTSSNSKSDVIEVENVKAVRTSLSDAYRWAS